jgi:DNA modification methylase
MALPDTLLCLKQGFRFIGIEIDEVYCKIAEHRIKPYLAQKSLLEFAEVKS